MSHGDLKSPSLCLIVHRYLNLVVEGRRSKVLVDVNEIEGNESGMALISALRDVTWKGSSAKTRV